MSIILPLMALLAVLSPALLSGPAVSQARGAAGPATSLERAWTADIGTVRGTALVGIHPVGELVLVADAAGGVSALDVETGDLRWFVQLEAPLDVVPSPGGRLLALAAGTQLIIVDAATGRHQSMVGLSSPLESGPVCDDERAYLPLIGGHQLIAVDAASGRERWSLRMDDGFSGGASLVGGSVVALPCWDGTLRGVAASGRPSVNQQRWALESGPVIGTPVASGTILYTGSTRSVQAVGGGSGRLRWRVFPGGELRSAPIVVGDVVVVQTDVDTVALARDSGRIAWRGASAEPLGGLSGTVVLQAADERARLYDATSGQLLNAGVAGRVVVADPVLIEWRQGGLLAAWRLAR